MEGESSTLCRFNRENKVLIFDLIFWSSEKDSSSLSAEGVILGAVAVAVSDVLFSFFPLIVFQFSNWTLRITFHGVVKHAGCPVVSQKLSMDLSFTVLSVLLSWLGLQGVPSEGRKGQEDILDASRYNGVPDATSDLSSVT